MLSDEFATVEIPIPEPVRHAPALYRLLANLLADPALPGRLRPLILAAVAYFTLPADIMAEDLRGPLGYADDVFLSAFLLNRILQETGSESLLEDNWDGDGKVLPLLSSILDREQELIGDRRDLMLWYIGYEYLCLE